MTPTRCVVSLLLLTAVASVVDAEEAVGVVVHEPGAWEGYNLYSPLDGAGSYLIDNRGRVVHFWDAEYRSYISYLQDDGRLFRPTSFGNGGNGHFHGGGSLYSVQEMQWNGRVTWEFVYASEDHLMHHDIEPLPNGNVLLIAWERKSMEEAVAAGRNPELLGETGLWPLQIVEVSPVRPSGGEIVWKWHVWDHLIQDFDSTKANYGDPAAHPGRVEINPPGLWMDAIPAQEREQLVALGYLEAAPANSGDAAQRRRRAQREDWLHTNAIAYNPELDQIAVSTLGNNEVWIIDHSTTTEEASGSAGGRYGKGGDLLYRWGNPAAYRAGGEEDQTLFAQHDVHWIPEGRPGAGNLLVFNNGRGRDYSSVVEIAPPQSSPGHYTRDPGQPFGPTAPVWEYTAPDKKEFYSIFISGAQRLPNGNTLICYGSKGIFFEVTPAGETVWRYVSPIKGPEGANHSNANQEPKNVVFRVHRYATDHPAFRGKDLEPGLEITEFLEKHSPRIPLLREATDGD